MGWNLHDSLNTHTPGRLILPLGIVLGFCAFIILGPSTAFASGPDEFPNGDFEDWAGAKPVDYGAFQPPMPLLRTVHRSADAFSGNAAVRLKNLGLMGRTFNAGLFYCRGGCATGGSEDRLEFPVTQRAEALCGVYKASLLGGDRLLLNLAYRRGGEVIAGTDQGTSQEAFISQNASDWTPFRIPITPVPGREAQVPDRALFQAALFGPGYPQRPTDFGNRRSQAWLDDIHFCGPRVELDIHRPALLGGGAVDDGIEESQGAQTFVNLDNDDGDGQFDHDPDATATFDAKVPADNELVELTLRLEPRMSEDSLARLTLGEPAHVKLWRSANKETAVDPNQELTVPGDFIADDKGYSLTLWAEGVQPHWGNESTLLELTWDAVPELKDVVKLTVLGVSKIRFQGDGNGYSQRSTRHENDRLDADPLFTPTNELQARRVFPGGRHPTPLEPRDKVVVRVELTAPPVEDVVLYARSFDVDDPTSNLPPVDPNDSSGPPGSQFFFGSQLTFSEENDNRTTGPKEGELEGAGPLGIAPLEFPAGQTQAEISFRVSQHPGDNYRIVVHGDEAFLEHLRNLDAEDGLRIVDPRVDGDEAEQREIRSAQNYASNVLTVWRLVHVERDSMAAVDKAMNRVEGHLVRALAGPGDLRAETVTVDKDLVQYPVNDDYSVTLERGGKGRFEEGTLMVGTTRVSSELLGNGRNFVRGKNGIDIPVEVHGSPGTSVPVLRGWARAFSGDSFELTLDAGVPGRDYWNGTLVVAGISMDIAAIDIHGATTVKVVDPKGIPYGLVDDDHVDLLPMKPDLSTAVQAFERAHVVLVDDGGGNPAWSTDSVPFQLHVGVTDAEFGQVFEPYRNSKSSEAETFWVAYVASAFQYAPFRAGTDKSFGDNDPDSEHGVSGFTYPTDLTHPIDPVQVDTVGRGGQGSIILLETEREIYEQDLETYGRNERDHAENVAHEIGHQFGLDHAHMGLMEERLQEDPRFVPKSIHFIRCRIASPGH